MTVKEYLKRGYKVDQRINTKLEQIRTLNELAHKVTSTLRDVPVNGSGSQSRMEDTIVKIIDLENEINDDVDELVEIKKQITDLIKSVDDIDYQLLLESRYLCFMSWEEIAVKMGYTIRHINRIHSEALKACPMSPNEIE